MHGSGRPASIVHEEKAQLDFSRDMSYGDYLHLDQILGPAPLSPAHDEMLFIVQHQTSELWMKLMLHELRGRHAALASPRAKPEAFKMLARVSASWSSWSAPGPCCRP
jgi:tryptophan 2,3-dioxygenase